MYILSCLNPCCLYKQNKNMYYYPPHFPLKWERSCLCMAIPCIALRESSLWVPRRSGRIQERVFIVTKLLHGFLGSLYALLYDFILAAIEWAQRDIRFWFRVSIPQLQYIYTTHTCWGFSFVWLGFFLSPQSFFFPSLWQLKDQQHYSPCTWFVHLEGKKIFWIWCLLNQVP